MEIRLTEPEVRLLIRLLQSEIRDLRSEIYHAESHDVKAALHEQEDLARALLERLERLLEPAPAAS